MNSWAQLSSHRTFSLSTPIEPPVFRVTMNQLIMLAMAMLACLQPMVYAQRSGTTRGNSYIGCNTFTPALASDTYYAQDSSTTYASGLACSVSHNNPDIADGIRMHAPLGQAVPSPFSRPPIGPVFVVKTTPRATTTVRGTKVHVHPDPTKFTDYELLSPNIRVILVEPSRRSICRSRPSMATSTRVISNVNRSHMLSIYQHVQPPLSSRNSLTYLRPAAASIDARAPMTLRVVV
jgi:hypothetical protein